MSAELVDEEARRIIREDTDRTLFVAAGAGPGKTRMRIKRVQQPPLRAGRPMCARPGAPAR